MNRLRLGIGLAVLGLGLYGCQQTARTSEARVNGEDISDADFFAALKVSAGQRILDRLLHGDPPGRWVDRGPSWVRRLAASYQVAVWIVQRLSHSTMSFARHWWR